jgi:hypothetical protein
MPLKNLIMDFRKNMSALAASDLPVEKCQLHLPPLEELATVLESGLSANFSQATVEVVDCPDLTSSDWGIAAQVRNSWGLWTVLI